MSDRRSIEKRLQQGGTLPSSVQPAAGVWSCHIDPSSQKVFYMNSRTSETTWQKPIDFVDSNDSDDLDPNYSKIWDKTSNRYYYAHKITRATTWVKPLASASLSTNAPPSIPFNTSLQPQVQAQATESISPDTNTTNNRTSSVVDSSTVKEEEVEDVVEGVEFDRVLDVSTNRYYFVNRATNDVQWEVPDEWKNGPPKVSPSTSNEIKNNNNNNNKEDIPSIDRQHSHSKSWAPSVEVSGSVPSENITIITNEATPAQSSHGSSTPPLHPNQPTSTTPNSTNRSISLSGSSSPAAANRSSSLSNQNLNPPISSPSNKPTSPSAATASNPTSPLQRQGKLPPPLPTNLMRHSVASATPPPLPTVNHNHTHSVDINSTNHPITHSLSQSESNLSHHNSVSLISSGPLIIKDDDDIDPSNLPPAPAPSAPSGHSHNNSTSQTFYNQSNSNPPSTRTSLSNFNHQSSILPVNDDVGSIPFLPSPSNAGSSPPPSFSSTPSTPAPEVSRAVLLGRGPSVYGTAALTSAPAPPPPSNNSHGNPSVAMKRYPTLPQPLAASIQNFQLAGFAEQHFRVFKKRTGLVSTRIISNSELLCWQKEPLEKSLLTSSKKYDKGAVQCFEIIATFMGDRPTKKQPGLVAKELLSIGISKEPMRDEIFCQLCKQTNKNPNAMSTVNGWKLLTLCCSAFLPTKSFQSYLLAYFCHNYNSTLPQVHSLAPYCHYRISYASANPTQQVELTLTAIDDLAAKGVPHHTVLYGASLDYLLTLQGSQGLSKSVPLILVSLCDAMRAGNLLQTRGLFRIAAQKEEVAQARMDLERTGNYASLKNRDVHVLADLLKIWLRSLYDPVIPRNLQAECLAASDTESALKCVAKLPYNHFVTLDYLLDFLVDVAKLQSVNMMNEENIAIVFSPNLLRNDTESDPSTIAMNSNKEKNFVKNIIMEWQAGRKCTCVNKP